MPDPDLAALLRERAADAPAPRVLTDATIARVRRRRGLRVAALGGSAVAAAVATVAVAVPAVVGPPRIVPVTTHPPAPRAATSAPDDPCRGERGRGLGTIDVAVAREGLAYERRCYVVSGTGGATFANPQTTPHGLRIVDAGGRTRVELGPIASKPGEHASMHARLAGDLEPGRYTIVCPVHPAMRSVLVVVRPPGG
jgi:plastocyanin